MSQKISIPSNGIRMKASSRRRFLKKIGQSVGIAMVSQMTLFPTFSTYGQQDICNKEAENLFIMALADCGLIVQQSGNTPSLSVASGKQEDLCQALRCLAETMKQQDVTSANSCTDLVKIRWSTNEILTLGPNEIVIATPSLANALVRAYSIHPNCSVYASGGTSDSISADALSIGPLSNAVACGGHAPLSLGGNGGHAVAYATGNTISHGGFGSEGGRGGKAASTSFQANATALAIGGGGGAHLISSGGAGGDADADSRAGSAMAIGGSGGEANLAGNGGNGGNARAESGIGSAEAQGGAGGHLAECCGNGGHGGHAEAVSTGNVASARGGAGGTGRGQGQRGGNGGNATAKGNPSLVTVGQAGVGEERAINGKAGEAD